MSTTEEQRAAAVMEAIFKMATALYPFPHGSNVSDHLTFGLGQIAGIASKALRDAGYRKAGEVV